jgi:nucleoid DNA-binding protein
MGLKENIIKKVAEKTEVEASIVESIITHQFASVVSRMSSEYSIEVSGFGKFLFLPAKAQRLVNSLEKNVAFPKEEMTPAEEKKFRADKEDVETIRKRLNEYNAKLKTNSGGVEECSDKG